MHELVVLYPGNIRRASGTDYEFQSLIESGYVSGTLNYTQMVQRSFFGTNLVPARALRRVPNGADYTLAAYIKGTSVPEDSTATPTNVNIIVICDLDFISQQFFELRKRGFENLNFDNVTFFLNCMDLLVGDESFIELRKRRVRHRTLTAVASRVLEFVQIKSREEQEAEGEAQIALSIAQRRLNERVAEVRSRTDLDEQTKQIMAQSLQEVENKRFEALKASIEANKDAKIRGAQEEMESQKNRFQNNIKTLAVVLPPIPVFVLGIWIFLQRRKREEEGAAAARRLRS